MDSAPISRETLLAHREWVRAVARAVVRDPNAADDVEQETWLAALRKPPRDASSLRGWFGAVTRSRARRIGRTDSRREARESVVARREATPSAAELAELADTHRRVVEAVVDLDEPYRETILLRYFEGLSIDDVAARTSSPVETTRSRIKRGVAKLRERLEREFGTRGRPWHLALAPLIGGTRETTAGAGLGAAVGGGVVMASTTKTVAAVAAVLLLAGIGAVVVPKWRSADANVAAAPEPAAVPAPPPKPRATEEKRAAPPRPPRQRAEETPAAAPEEPKPRAEDQTAAQKLARTKLTMDWKETPLQDALVELTEKSGVSIVIAAEVYDPRVRAQSGDVVESLHLDVEISAQQALDLVTQLKGLAYVIEEPRVVIVPLNVKRDPSKNVIVPQRTPKPLPLTVIGRVVDANGVVVPGAQIVRRKRGRSLEPKDSAATTDVAGRYELKLWKPYGSLEARAEGQVPSFSISVDGEPGAQVTIDLATRGAGGMVVVRLTAEAGSPPDVLVIVGSMQDVETTLPDGRKAVQCARERYWPGKGDVTFAGIVPGKTTVSLHHGDYERASQPVEVVAGGTVEVELKLVKKPPVTDTLAATRVSLNFRDARPAEIVKFLNDAKGLSIVMDPALAQRIEGIKVTLAVTDRPLDETLRALCREIGGATYDVQGPVVFIRAEKK